MNLHCQTHELELLTPAWVSGADPLSAEIRVPTLRGQLRFWMRRLYPNESLDREIMGHAGQGNPSASSVILRLIDWSGRPGDQNLEDYTREKGLGATSDPGARTARQIVTGRYAGKKEEAATSDPEGYFLWPLRPSKKSQQKRAVLHPDTPGKNATFKVETQWRLLTSSQKSTFIPAFQRSWDAFSLLGAIGTRSTRGYGGVWPKGLNLCDAADFARRLEFLPSSVAVRLLEGDFKTARAAIAHSAKWFRALRIGTSHFGETPSEWGRNDHDVALQPTQGSHLYRPILGLPLAQQYKSKVNFQTKYEWKNPDNRGQAEWNDRYPSPVRIKVVRIAGAYRVALVILRDQLLPENTPLSIEERGARGSRRSRVSHDLINHIAKQGEQIH